MVAHGAPRRDRVQVLNASIDCRTLDLCVDELVAVAQIGERGWLATVNVAILMTMRQDRELQDYVDRARWVVADGEPVVWLTRMLGRTLPQRVTGIDLIERVCGRAQEDGLVVFFLGASEDVITAAAQATKGRYPRLKLYSADGYFNDDEALARVSAIAGAGTNFLFVGMGVPRQERFIEEHWDGLKVNVAIGVGGSFDVIGGLRRRAPLVMQRAGLEWVCRLVQEPRRLWRRYLVTGMQFGALALGAVFRERLGLSRRQP